jgi:hypothetical protein
MRIVETIAMQKVVGSSPISRLREARSWSGFFVFLVVDAFCRSPRR